ncbi:MAG: hypothetical protein MJ193_05620, partial [Clostridia bacterium]|nr:hypothetical protein [Clostridia bacterium]
KNKETKTMSLFGDINIDATLLKGYAVEPDWNSIDESKASSVSHFHLAAAIKNSVIAYTYSGPEFVFLREGEYFIDVNDILNGYISSFPIFPEGTTIDDIIDLIETVRKLVYYFEKYEAPFKFILQALMQRIDLSSMVPGISWIKKSEDEENTYSFSFEYLAQSIKEFENDSIKEYLDGIFGNGFVNGISNYITQIPNETVDEIYKTIVYIAGTFGGMSEDALIDDFNILLSILLNDVVGNMPGETQTIKTNIREHLGNPIDLRYARERYNDYTVYELAYGRLGVDTDIDVDVYLKNQEEFKELWEASISTVETVILDASISTIVDTLLERFASYSDVTTLGKLLD